MKLGFAGLGRMGTPMARNLVDAGFDVSVWTRTTQKAKAFSDETACKVASSPRQLGETCDLVFTMLADDQSSHDVHFGHDGIFADASAKYLVEMGTLSPDHIRQLAEDAPNAVTVIDAPVSGATQAARDAQLLFLAGCSDEHFSHIEPFLKVMGRQTIVLQKLGAGSVMKLAVNTLIHGLNQALAEAMTLAEASGVASELAFDVIEASAAAAPMIKYRRPLYLDEAAQDVSFTVSLARKDMEIATALAEQHTVSFPQGRKTLSLLRDAESKGYAQRDMASMLDYMRRART